MNSLPIALVYQPTKHCMVKMHFLFFKRSIVIFFKCHLLHCILTRQLQRGTLLQSINICFLLVNILTTSWYKDLPLFSFRKP